MERMTVTTGDTSCTVVVGRGLLSDFVNLVGDAGLPQPQTVVTNSTVAPLYGKAAAETIGGRCYELPDGEEYKVWHEVEGLCRSWLEAGLHRDACVLAVGGGVVTDTTGFAASIFMRGIQWVAAPTTLLAMVDASIGGKTGVNLDVGKNLVGTFWHPRAVIADVDTLRTLPPRELRAGLAEVVKGAWIGDRDLLDLVDPEAPTHGALWEELVRRAMMVKIEVVEADEREAGPRKALNLGHTLGHALEAATSYRRFLHGEAVAWGLRAVTRIARARGLMSERSAERLDGVVSRLEPLPPIDDLSVDEILDHLGRDKKRDDLGIAWVLPTDDGIVLDQRITSAEVRQVLQELAER